MVLIPDPQLVEKFVIESNTIEGAPVENGSPWVTKHLAGVHQVIADALLAELTPPETLHEILFRGLPPMGENAGSWRDVRVRVGDDAPPGPEDLPRLMTRWWSSATRAAQDEPEHLTEAKAWFYHHAFECIHPFIDGNGRVGRLVLNQLLLIAGRPWQVVEAVTRGHYYEEIRRFRNTKWPDLYRRWTK